MTAETVLVTGASSGIGAATVRRVAADGADVALLTRSEDRLQSLAEEVADEHGVETHVVPADVRDSAAVAAAVEALGPITGVVVNAGLAQEPPTTVNEPDVYRRDKFGHF